MKVKSATAAVQKLPKTEEEAKELMKFIKNDSHARVCTTSLDGMKMFTHVRGILHDLKAQGLEYLIAAAYTRREIETDKAPLQELFRQEGQARGRGTGRGDGDYVAIRIGSETAEEGE